MKYTLDKIIQKGIKILFLPLIVVTFFSGCFYLNIDGSNNFHSLVNNMIKSSYDKLKLNVEEQEIVFVTDFANVNSLNNKTKLGFLLSEVLKDVLSNKDIIVRQAELGQNFKLGDSGFKVLTREQREIDPNVYTERFALVGTYSITQKRLWVFIKLIDIYTGEILASSTQSTSATSEIRELEKNLRKNENYTYKPLVL